MKKKYHLNFGISLRNVSRIIPVERTFYASRNSSLYLTDTNHPCKAQSVYMPGGNWIKSWGLCTLRQ